MAAAAARLTRRPAAARAARRARACRRSGSSASACASSASRARSRAWRTPCEERRPASVASRSSSSPSTLTKTRAERRSGLVSTAVTVTNPMRGSWSSVAIAAPITSRMTSLMRRMRRWPWRQPTIAGATVRPASAADVVEAEQVALEAAAVGAARLDEALELVGAALDLRVADERAQRASSAARCRARRSPRPRPEALPHLRLQRADAPCASPSGRATRRRWSRSLEQADVGGQAPTRPTPASSRPAWSRRTRGRRPP